MGQTYVLPQLKWKAKTVQIMLSKESNISLNNLTVLPDLLLLGYNPQ